MSDHTHEAVIIEVREQNPPVVVEPMREYNLVPRFITLGPARGLVGGNDESTGTGNPLFSCCLGPMGQNDLNVQNKTQTHDIDELPNATDTCTTTTVFLRI